MSELSPLEIIESLKLKPHPEGGYYRETVLTTNKNDDRGKSSCIYFLIESNNPSKLHKIDVNEYWFYHYGNTDILLKSFPSQPGGVATTITLGASSNNWQHFIPKNTWFGAKTKSDSSGLYALVSCVCVPAFCFSGFELEAKNILLSRYPEHTEIIKELGS